MVGSKRNKMREYTSATTYYMLLAIPFRRLGFNDVLLPILLVIKLRMEILLSLLTPGSLLSRGKLGCPFLRQPANFPQPG